MEKKVLDAMKKAGKPVKAGDIVELINEDKAEVSKAIKDLKNQGKIESPKVCFYKPVD
ncbi:MAG: MarR family transcriptional regulator [Candidatus Marinimicrobia bacterium]|nr:MarR family transcriptional regulator [Candidatus Neomarinimicrobiota bacterium]